VQFGVIGWSRSVTAWRRPTVSRLDTADGQLATAGAVRGLQPIHASGSRKNGFPSVHFGQKLGHGVAAGACLVVAAERMHAGREGGGERGSGHALSEPKSGDVNGPETSHRRQSYLLERPRFT
jgi:hypothetical protein